MRRDKEPPARRWRLGIVIRDDDVLSRGVIGGVLKYVAGRRDWRVVGGVTPRQADDVFRRWPPDGVITSFPEAVPAGLPVVGVISPFEGIPSVAMDDARASALGVEHFRERGFRHFAFVGHRGEWWSDAREAGFRAALLRWIPDLHQPLPRFVSGGFSPGLWLASSRRLSTWLSRLPKPVAVMASNDTRGRETIDAALMAGLRVPDDVAVLGVDNDEVECEMAHVPMSSVVHPTAEIGYRAAEMLERLLEGQALPPDRVLVPPDGVRVRLSTDILAIEDPVVGSAYRFIREHVEQACGVADVARQAGVARRTLEQRYRQALGRSVHDDIVAVRLNVARDLLAHSATPLKEVARRAGFANSVYFSKAFRRQTSTTPGAYRRNALR